MKKKKKQIAKLALRKVAVRELASNDLTIIAAGDSPPHSLPLNGCSAVVGCVPD